MMARQSSVRDAMVREYLTDLEVALAGADPHEREETLASIREHLDLVLPAEATANQIVAAIVALGPANVIAAEASPGYFAKESIPEIKEPVPQRNPAKESSSAYWILGSAITALILFFPLFSLAAALAIVNLFAGAIGLHSKRSNQTVLIVAVAISFFVLCAILIYYLQVHSFLLSLLPTSGI
ncbi:hypothetical protein V5R04_11980 [Jonesiaceae bacterium BS-20]|uniref:DUF1700 domain-containing protein n=1 Tax=Jonesiaceae bacterium BS-20 TaxID=3120821 RepID=A0AAU7DUI0_9MICO